MNVTFRQINAFIAVARHKSFTKAADELHLTQSSLSGLIKEMERQLDITLFDRTTRQLHLSEGGTRLLPYALKVLDDMRLLNNEIYDLKDFHQGKVRVAASQQLAATIMPELIKEFKKIHPDVQVSLIDCGIGEVMDRVQILDADIGIGPEYPFSNDIVATELFASPFYLIIKKDHPLSGHDELDWGDIPQGELITLQSAFAEQIRNALPLDLSERLFRADYEVNFLSTALGMTKMGLGITLALTYAKTWVEQHNLTMIPIKNPTIERKFLLYTHKHRSPSPAVITFKKFLVDYAKHWDA
ncbi:LysR family transcriptional regulator [Moraxella haemolytica]|uniref:LysR family transcriptional regulator n=1 Tax=Moraxella haemolytica TaxID=2904119 RepID=UPI0025433892|nr:LysR family transcriptional regulator [Moraxella sp. ZY171148]WII95152.1 LysR family transcriptional regulator [Moraxella sp. ZY171148]